MAWSRASVGPSGVDPVGHGGPAWPDPRAWDGPRAARIVARGGAESRGLTGGADHGVVEAPSAGDFARPVPWGYQLTVNGPFW